MVLRRPIPLLYTALGILFLVSGCYKLIGWIQLKQTHRVTVATVVSVETRVTRVNQDVVKTLYHPIVTYKAEDGWQTTQSLPEGREVLDFKTDDKFDLIYPVGNPELAKIRHWYHGPLLPLLLIVAALFCGALAWSWARRDDLPRARARGDWESDA